MGFVLAEGCEKGSCPLALADGLGGEVAVDVVAVLDAARRARAEATM
jgi:hypothetical protein